MEQALLADDTVIRRTFCEWTLNSVYNGEIDPHLIFFTDEAWFHLHGYVCTQNNRYWSSEKPNIVHKYTFMTKKLVNGAPLVEKEI